MHHVLRRVLARLLGRVARRDGERHVLGGPVPPPTLVRLPRQPQQLLGSDSWRPLAQLADQRIRAHRGERLSVGEMVQTVSSEVEDAVSTQPIDVSLVAWRTWAAATGTPWPLGFHELLVGQAGSGADEVEAALHVQSDLAALMPQLVAARLSENGR